MSLSERVIIEPVPKRSKSLADSSSDLSYTALRISQATLAARRAER